MRQEQARGVGMIGQVIASSVYIRSIIDTYIEVDTLWRFQRRVNKKKVVFIEYGDCVIIAGRRRSMTNRLVREIPAHNHV